jgi:hypothetical protein
MTPPKTQKNSASVIDFVNAVEDEVKRRDSHTLLDLFK